ncbi:hypothetical protein [Lacipirellula limnantheis]|uniref:DUF2946 domain-containing protein n=1 Tax=Lacipirellula limnantheis TaxID=2528024 RepID=A0A517TX09_9BACT|nr:hypothetical protein [Lacipirellula limnantheis]QDT72900.1 hypothetical protein I41_20850 [Lacipirellula limnantheis]
MPRPATTRSTALALLALMGLVGVLGAGLHSLVHAISGRIDCWRYHAAACCSVEFLPATNDELAAETTGQSVKKLAADSHADCPICTLLARYHAPPVARLNFKTTALLHADVADCDTLFLPRAVTRAHRPRGPPSWT